MKGNRSSFWKFCFLLFSSGFLAARLRLLELDSCFCWIFNWFDLIWFEVCCMCSDWLLLVMSIIFVQEIEVEWYFSWFIFFVSVIFLWYPSSAKLMVDYVLCWIFIGYDYRRSNVLQLVTSDCEWFLCCLDSWQFCVRLFIYLLHSSRWLLPFFFGLFVNLDFAITKINRIKWLSQWMKLNNE